MPTDLTLPAVIEIPLSRAAEAAHVLATAFTGYPVMDYVFEDCVDNTDSIYHAIFYMECLSLLGKGWPLLGVENASGLAAVGALSGPGDLPNPPGFDALEENFKKQVSPQVLERLDQYNELKSIHVLKEPQLYLEDLGVLPEARGRGLGGLIIRHAVRLAESTPGLTGLGLDTQVESNVSLYQHFGFQVYATDMLGQIPMWFMIRRNLLDPERRLP